MPIISLPYLLGTIAVQAGSALFNAKRGKKHSEELAKKQQEYEERVLKDGIENARAEFAEMCALQRELELEMQQDRLQMIRDSLKSNIMLEAYRHSLKDWPLLVPPFVIKNEYLPVLEFEEREQNHTIPVNCIMTTSSDTKFNLKIFTLLEEKLAQFFSKHWRGDKAIRFYQQAWRNNVTDIGAMMHDIKAHLSEVPTIVLSPIIDGNKLKFAFSWWGMSNKIEDEHIAEPDNVFDPELSVEFTPGMDYDEKTIEKIVDETFNKLAAFISYFADLYYWNFYKFAINVPNFIATGILNVQNEIKNALILNLINALDNNMDFIDVAHRLSYIKSLQKVDCEVDINKILCQEIKNIEECKFLQVDALNELTEIKNNKKVSQLIVEHTEEIIEEIEIIDDAILNHEYLYRFMVQNMQKAFKCSLFSYIEWSPNIIIGCFCNEDYEPCIYNISNTSRFFVFIASEAPLNENPYLTFEIKVIPINNILKKINMAKKDGLKQRLGRRLINVGQKLVADSEDNNSKRVSPWDNLPSTQVDELQVISNYFINGVDNGSIQYSPYTQPGNNLAMRDVLNWLDRLTDQAIGNNNQVYIVKTNYIEKNLLLYCAFLAKDDTFDLTTTCKYCFICGRESEEMRNLFAGKKVYIIPFEN